MSVLRNDGFDYVRLFLGLIILACGIYLTKIASMGLAPWGVFHDGLSEVTGLSFGLITQIVGAIVLVISMVLFKTKIGPGTVLNVAIVGPIIDGLSMIQGEVTDHVILQTILFTVGFVLMTFGRSLYISSRMGQGPRDGFFVGIARSTRFQVKHIKPAIELTVVVLGALLGGDLFFGTAIIVVFSGYLVQWFFKILHFDPKTASQRTLKDYFTKQVPD